MLIISTTLLYQSRNNHPTVFLYQLFIPFSTVRTMSENKKTGGTNNFCSKLEEWDEKYFK